MGFRTNSYATVWDIKPVSDTVTEIRISTSRKNRQSGEYEQDFSGFVRCIGTACATSAAKLQKNSRIKIGDCEVTTKYDTGKKTTYTNFTMFSFDLADSTPKSEPKPVENQGDAFDNDGELPF